MARSLAVVLSQGQSNNPEKRKLEEDLVAALLFEKGIELTIIPHLYDLKPDGTGMVALQGLKHDLVFVSWLYPRATHWLLDRQGIKGHMAETIFDQEIDKDDDDLDEAPPEPAAGIGAADVPNRRIYCIDLRMRNRPEPFVEEIRRIHRESSVKVVGLGGLPGGNGHKKPTPAPAPAAANGALPATLSPAASTVDDAHASPIRIEESTGRRWYPVIDFSRCTNCMECLDFCLFGVYGVDRFDRILVEQPDNCKKGCPACSRVCPANAIIFPQHKTPAIAGSPEADAGVGLKIDLSKLFGAPDKSPLEMAVAERDTELMADGRDAVGMAVGIPKRQAQRDEAPRDNLDDLMDKLDELDL